MSATWDCLCRKGTEHSWDVRRCHTCGAERPDTAQLARIAVEVGQAQEALERFDKLSEDYGRLVAMQVILARHERAS